ncbi:hypothetical protein QBC35DRAFT_61304 [Podospora australis]|uniref:C2H2-type domain-containing protein n=1 Tax=Podospora australis TaxID=1536484 RepID=A0AAN6WZ21_9PEZI|nr:hypothetical protein QBC35DRAFT_61304 [Podospora australis]
MSQRSHYPQHDGFASIPFGVPDQNPDSPDPLNTMDGLGGHQNAAAQPYEQFTATTTHGAGSQNAFANNNRYNNNQSQQNLGLEREIYKFIQNQQQSRFEPWNPVRAAAVTSPWTSNFSSTSFSGYRDTAPPPSEADTIGPSAAKLLSDSGYGSAARHSIGIPSYNGDDNAETRSLVQQYHQHGLSLETVSNATHERPRKRRARSQRGAGSTTSGVKHLKCPDCSNFSAKTPSELKKHRARHEKPYKCDIENCPKAKEGFSTSNDLDRHKICVHKVYRADASIYRCNLDECKDKPKDWPRQDNFRQHIRRVHRMDPPSDLSQFLYNPNNAVNQSLIGVSEHTPSEAGRHVASHQVSQLSWPVLEQSQVIPTGLLHSNSGNLGVVQPADLHHFPTPSVMDQSVLDRSEYASLMSPTNYHSQDQGTLDNGGLSVDMELLTGLIQPRFQRDDGSAPRELPLDDQSCVAPNRLSHTSMEVCHMEQALEIATPHKEVIQLEDDSPSVYQETKAFTDHHQPQAELAISPDAMVLDINEPIQDSASDHGLEFEETQEAQHDGTADLQILSKLSEHLASESSPDAPSSPELLVTPSPPVSNTYTPHQADPEDVEAVALAALKSLMSLKEKGGLKDTGVLDRLIMGLGYQKSEELDTKDIKVPSTPSVQSDAGSHRCNKCGKTFNRPCELKKHLKRHEKPYACTFHQCDKRFGSKNDWKRHENSQHYQLEIWRCVEVTGGEGLDHACGKVYHRRESLKAHLEKDHQMKDWALVEKKLEEFRHGRNFESRFWCGFCVKTIEPQGCGGPAHSERFDHIDDHFMGKNGFEKAYIATWKSLDAANLADSSLSSQAARQAADVSSRKRGLEDEADNAASLLSSSSAPRSSSGKTKKKRRGGKADVFWTCCHCGECWNVDVTNQCMDACNHTQCGACPTWIYDAVQERDGNEKAAASTMAPQGSFRSSLT